MVSAWATANRISLGQVVVDAKSNEITAIPRLLEMLDLSGYFLEVTQRDIPKVPALRGKVVVSLFYEDSTRTRISFETAAKRLSCDVMSFSVGSSSVQKGESLRDTVQTIEAMGIDAVVVRHAAAGAPHRIAQWVDASVVNAGDGCHEHPTQALLDALTLRRHLGSDLDGGLTADDLPQGIDRPAELTKLTEALASRNWSADDIAGFEHANFARFFAACAPR